MLHSRGATPDAESWFSLAKLRLNRLAAKYTVALVLLAFVILLGILAPRFRNPANLANILEQVSVAGIVAMGMTVLLITANFDLSVGGIVALSGLAFASVANATGLAAGMAAALLTGLALGVINGVTVTKLRVNSLIATLGTGLAYSGLAILLSSFPLTLEDTHWVDLVNRDFFGLAIPVYVFVVVALVTSWILRTRILGRYFYAVGANTEAARYAGVPVGRVQFVPFVATGLLCAIASILLVGQLGSALPDAGSSLPLQVIAAVVVGGVSIAGGYGTVGMAIVGVLMLGVVANGFNMLNLNPNFSSIFTGLILVFAVAVDAALRTRRKGSSSVSD